MKARSRAKPRAKPAKADAPDKPAKPAKPAKPKAAKRTPARRPSEKETEEHFVRGVLTRGEAAKARRGKLPPGVTHEIVEEPESEEELPKIRRRRFSVV
jgi:hypothetical protein